MASFTQKIKGMGDARREKKEERAKQKEERRTQGATSIIRNEKIVCSNEMDLETFKLVFDAYDKNQDVIMGSDEEDYAKIMDANAYYFFTALVNMNTMLMRKIDTIQTEINELKSSLLPKNTESIQDNNE